MTTNAAGALDYSPFSAIPSIADVQSFRAASRRSGQAWATSSVDAGGAIQIVLFLFIAIVLGIGGLTSLFGTIVGFATGEASALGSLIVFLVAAGLAVGIAFAAYRVYRAAIPGMDAWTRWYQLTRFAQANGLLFSPGTPGPTYPGSVFGLGDNRYVYDHLYRNEGRFLDIGNYRYVTGSGRDRSTHHWGFIALRLDRAMPNMVLDAKSNNTLFGATNLPLSFASAQRLSLEGDFDRYFTLYCPKEYEQDALYVFTPDLMALLIEQAAQFDVEIVDDWMFVYSSKPLNLSDVPTLNHLFRIVDTVGAKTVSQTERYSDERIGSPLANMVAPQGRRLKRGWPVAGVFFFVVIAAYWTLTAMGILKD